MVPAGEVHVEGAEQLNVLWVEDDAAIILVQRRHVHIDETGGPELENLKCILAL